MKYECPCQNHDVQNEYGHQQDKSSFAQPNPLSSWMGCEGTCIANQITRIPPLGTDSNVAVCGDQLLICRFSVLWVESFRQIRVLDVRFERWTNPCCISLLRSRGQKQSESALRVFFEPFYEV